MVGLYPCRVIEESLETYPGMEDDAMIDDMGTEDIHSFLDKRSKAIREVQACWQDRTLLLSDDAQEICTSELARSGQNYGVGCPPV